MVSHSVKQLMASCDLCNRHCHADRNNSVGYCGQTAQLRAARAALYFWEEPCISGKNGSGAVFFSGCSLRCIFCQNHEIATDLVSANSTYTSGTGKTISIERLSEIFLELQEKGAHNINLVTPTHFVPQIISALFHAKEHGLSLPIVYNTGSYETVETLKMLDGLVDIYLPDLKYYSPELSLRYSNAPDYFACASATIAEMFRQVGMPQFYPLSGSKVPAPSNSVGTSENINTPESIIGPESISAPDSISDPESISTPDSISPSNSISTHECAYSPQAADLTELSENSLMKKGVIVRHLLLPGCIEDSKKVLSYLYQTYGDSIFVSIMSQYTPMPFLSSGQSVPAPSPHTSRYAKLNRRITEKEYNELTNYAISLGMENAFIQEMDAAEESFIPAFDLKGI